MEIKKHLPQNRDKRNVILSHLKNRTFLFVCIIVSLFVLTVFSAGTVGLYYGTKLKESPYSAMFSSAYRFFRPSLNIISHYVKGFIANPETIIIDVKHMDLQKLAYRVDNAKRRGRITGEDKAEEINATMTHKNDKYKIKLRLRGTYLDHLRGDKWSFRVKIKANKTLFGMSRFSLSSPETRAHIHEWIFQKAQEYEDLISLRYKFVKVVLNGKNIGIYALEEFFDKRLIENNRLREGIIARPTYDDLSIYQEKKVKANPLLRKSYEQLSSLLVAYRQKKLPAYKVFDIEKTSKVFALAEIFGGQHGHLGGNFVCYFNPVTMLLERIAYDSNVARKIERYGGMVTSPKAAYFVKRQFAGLLFEDPDFYRLYIQQLKRMTEPGYIPTFFETIRDELEDNLAILYKEYPYFDYFKRDYLTSNIKYIRKQLLEDGLTGANFLSHEGLKRINLYVDNLRDVSIRIVGLELDGKIIFKPKNEIIIEPTMLGEPNLVRLYLGSEDKSQNHYFDNAMLVYTVFGLEKIHKVEITGIPFELKTNLGSIDEVFYSDFAKKESNVEQWSFLNIDKVDKVITISRGKYKIDKDLVVPSGYSFVLEAGVELNLVNSATILSYSPVCFEGSKNKPIKIFSEDLTGQGVIVLKAKEKSYITNTVFNKLSAPNVGGWSMTGAVTFYQSDVEFDTVECSDNRNSDDCINVIRSEYRINNSLFKNTFADGLDTDFCTGIIANTTFINTGNDAIDGSGSSLIAENIRLKNIGDKGFSCGEKSDFKISDIDITNANICFASKDNSYLFVKDINISSSNTGFAVFQKKPEYGPAKIEAVNVKYNNVQNPFVLENGSKLIVDQIKMKPNKKNVKNLLYQEK